MLLSDNKRTNTVMSYQGMPKFVDSTVEPNSSKRYGALGASLTQKRINTSHSHFRRATTGGSMTAGPGRMRQSDYSNIQRQIVDY